MKNNENYSNNMIRKLKYITRCQCFKEKKNKKIKRIFLI